MQAILAHEESKRARRFGRACPWLIKALGLILLRVVDKVFGFQWYLEQDKQELQPRGLAQ